MRKQIALAIALSTAGSLAIAGSHFDKVDTNDDGRISKTEFQAHVDTTTVFQNSDADANGYLDNHEFHALGLDRDFDAFDGNRDSQLDKNELYDGMFSAFDDNENGHWDDGEWDDAGDAGWFDI